MNIDGVDIVMIVFFICVTIIIVTMFITVAMITKGD